MASYLQFLTVSRESLRLTWWKVFNRKVGEEAASYAIHLAETRILQENAAAESLFHEKPCPARLLVEPMCNMQPVQLQKFSFRQLYYPGSFCIITACVWRSSGAF